MIFLFWMLLAITFFHMTFFEPVHHRMTADVDPASIMKRGISTIHADFHCGQTSLKIISTSLHLSIQTDDSNCVFKIFNTTSDQLQTFVFLNPFFFA